MGPQTAISCREVRNLRVADCLLVGLAAKPCQKCLQFKRGCLPCRDCDQSMVLDDSD